MKRVYKYNTHINKKVKRKQWLHVKLQIQVGLIQIHDKIVDSSKVHISKMESDQHC